MFAYTQNNPVMYYDPSGKLLLATIVLGLALIATVTVALTTEINPDVNEAVNDWLNEVPDNSFTIPSSDDLLNVVVGIWGISNNANPKFLNPNIKKVNKISQMIGSGLFIIDVGNTLINEESNLTRRQRIHKIGIQTTSFVVGGVVATVGSAVMFSGLGVGGGAGIMVTMPVGAWIMWKGFEEVSKWETKMYEEYGLE